MEPGAQSVMICGTSLMLVSYVDSSDMEEQVRKIHKLYQTTEIRISKGLLYVSHVVVNFCLYFLQAVHRAVLSTARDWVISYWTMCNVMVQNRASWIARTMVSAITTVHTVKMPVPCVSVRKYHT